MFVPKTVLVIVVRVIKGAGLKGVKKKMPKGAKMAPVRL